MKRSQFFLPFLLLALLAACGDKKEPPARGPSEVGVIKVEPHEIPVSFEFTAQTQSSHLVEVHTRVSGFLDKRLYTEGSVVREGQQLFQMDRKPFEAQLAAARGELAAQQARLAVAEATLARVKPLAAQNALSQKDLDDAVGSQKTAQAAVEVARANVLTAELNLGYTQIRSPLNGLASFAKIQEGAYLNANGQDSLLTTVAALDPIWVEFSVSENELLRYREQVANGVLRTPEKDAYQVEIQLADGTIFGQRGRLTFADISFAQGTGTMLMRAEIANPKQQLMPGQFVRARLHGAVHPKGIVVPQKALQQSGKGFFVWIVDSEGKAQVRPVEVGKWDGDQWLVLRGLAGGESVIVDGLLRLAPGAPVKPAAPAAPAAAGAAK